MSEYSGWLLDLYSGPQRGVVFWLLCEDGRRLRFVQDFPVTFYASGPSARLRQLWCFLQSQPLPIRLARTERRDLFTGPTVVLAACLDSPSGLSGLFQRLVERFPDLTFYDADLQIALRHAAVYGTFPLARCRVRADVQGLVQELEVLDSRWDLDPQPPPLRTIMLEPDVDPFHAEPRQMLVTTPKGTTALGLREASSLGFLSHLIRKHDPDLILSARGDTWLLPLLLAASAERGCPLPLNRDAEGQVTYKKEKSYFAYNQVIYRGRQVHLAGRLHLDIHNAVMYGDYGLEGVFEMARVTSLPIQTVARVSPGTGISAMQIVTALRREILVPLRKEQLERPKTTSELFQADNGGMVYDPLIGLHTDVGEVDFASMYPGIMVRFNVSPETVGTRQPTAELVPELEVMVDLQHPGLIPQTLAPLLRKRLMIKRRLLTLSHRDCRYQSYKARAAAHKWLTVTCFGYLGYRNARFGKIEAHEAVTAYGREVLLRAKEAAEDLGFTVLHMYVDGMWVRQTGCRLPQDFQPLLDEISRRTTLPIMLDGIYKWVAFLPSRLNRRIAVPNRYFGVFQNGEIKVRGIEVRRHDTPVFIAETQMQVLEIFAQAPDADHLSDCLPAIRALVQCRLADLRQGRVPLEKLIVRQTVSRALDEFRTPSPAAVALQQLVSAGKSLRPGQSVPLIYIRGAQRARAWDLPEAPDVRTVDVRRYQTLLLRAVETITQPFGISAQEVLSAGRALPLPWLEDRPEGECASGAWKKDGHPICRSAA